jgi:hypothetical protein
MKILMPKSRSILIILAILTVIAPGVIFSQVRVTKITSPEMLAGKNGIVYTLPRTQVHVDLWITKTEKFAGPLAEFAADYLGLDEVIKNNSISYEISNTEIKTSVDPDPDQVYIIEKDDKGSGEVWISFGKSTPVLALEKFDKALAPEGFTSWNDDLFLSPAPGQIFRKYTESPTREVIDTITRKVSIDTLVLEQKIYKHSMVEFTDKEKAEEAAARIKQIEQDKYNLLVGYQETAYSRETMEFMYNKLEEQRLDYLELFTGISVNQTLKFDYQIFPDAKNENQEYILSGFSKNAGIIGAEGQNIISVAFKPDAVNAIPRESGTSQAVSGIVYRVPQSGRAVVSYQGKEIVSRGIEVLQLGSVLTLPPSFKRVEFDPETGALRSVIME